MPRIRVTACCCLLAAIVAVMPALPCLLTCAAEGHMAHMAGDAPTAPTPNAPPCHHLPAPLGSVVSTLAATVMLPPSASPLPVARAEPVASLAALPSLPSIPQLIPDPPPPRLG
ncbi:MAG TPA: hypothetical protein VFL88_11295 [Gemmatimonadales bacterium]|nr:hypothetical protein [Gemmatimonadales bacterium]